MVLDRFNGSEPLVQVVEYLTYNTAILILVAEPRAPGAGFKQYLRRRGCDLLLGKGAHERHSKVRRGK